MFAFKEPPEGELDHFLRRQREMPFSYAEVGATLAEPPAGYVVDHRRFRLGEGEETFRRAASALSKWRMFETGWTRVLPEGSPIKEGVAVCVVARHFGFYSLNPARIIRVLDEGVRYRRYGFVYGTLPGHSQHGEERFSVELLPDGSVYYDLYAFSRAGGALVRLGYPVRRALQRRFARDSGRAMLLAAARAAGGRKIGPEMH